MKPTRLGKVLKNPLGRVSTILISLFILIAILGYLIVPDPSPSANTMHLALANAPMGTEVDVLLIPKSSSNEEVGFIERWFEGEPSSYREVILGEYDTNDIKFLNYHPSTPGLLRETEFEVVDTIGVEYREFLGFGAELGELTTHYGEFSIASRTYYLGTDKYGRDLLSRLVLGGRVSIAVGFISVIISLLIGIPLGAAAGYFGGRTDRIVMWLVNVVWSVPTLLMVIALTFVLGKGFWQVFVAVGLTMWVEVARVVRGQVMSLRNMEFVEAAKVLGYSSRRIIWKHILPNAWAPVIVISAANFASAILMESGLSFLGIGAQPPTPSWGGIIRDHYAYIITGEAHLSLLPGLCIMILVLSFMTLGNTLRDALDVRSS